MHIAGIQTLKDQTRSPNQCYLTNNRDLLTKLRNFF